MDASTRAGKIGDWLWFLAFATVSSVWCVTAAFQLGPTFDEPLYVRRGLEGWRTGSHGALLRVGTMPLPIAVETLPLYLWERSQGVTLDPVGDLNALLPWARAGMLLFWWLLLFYARLAGRELAGPWGGRLAVALLALEPSLLAHAGLATTDIAITACLLALVYHFRTGREAGWWRRIGIPAFWFGAGVLSKASCLVYGPLCLLAVELHRLWGSRIEDRGSSIEDRGSRSSILNPRSSIFLFPFSAALRPFRRDLLRIIALGMLVVVIYCGSDWKTQPSFVEWAKKLPEGPLATAMVWLAENLRIFPNAFEGLVRQIKHNMHGHGTYLLGESHPRALWYYFPVLLTIKLSVPLLLLPLLVALTRVRSLANWACLAAAVLVLFSLTFRVQIGIRLVLPLVALAGVGVGAAAARAWQEVGPGWRRRVLTAAVPCGLLWTGGAAVAVWPHGLCYANELWGGSRHSYRLMSDSNYDWGQGLPELAQWGRKHGIASLDVWYFGSDPALAAAPFHHVPFHTLPLNSVEDVAAQVQGRQLAVSTTTLYGNVMTKSQEYTQTFLRRQRPVARTRTFLIYDFTGSGGLVRSTAFRRNDVIPPKGGTTNQTP